MGLRVVLFAIAFNALFWLGRQGLAPLLPLLSRNTAGWALAALAPCCLLVLFLRMQFARPAVLVLVSCISLTVVTTLSGLPVS